MEHKSSKELVHIRAWLERVDEIVERGKDAYLADGLLQEAGDSLMTKLGESANRNFLIHRYGQINRELTWLTLARDLPERKRSLETLSDAADAAMAQDAGGDQRLAEL